MTFDRYLWYDAEELATVRSTGTPREKHLFHLAASGLVDNIIRVLVQACNNDSELTGVGIVDVLGDGVEEVESGELHPSIDLEEAKKGKRMSQHPAVHNADSEKKG